MSGHSSKRRHPYLSIENWISGKLSFWRTPIPGSLFRYNVEMYERDLQESMDNTRDLKRLQANIGKS
jgi:hypothetical protein